MKSGRAHIVRFFACPLILAGMLFLLCSCTSVREDNGTPVPSETVTPTGTAPYGEEFPATPGPTGSQAETALPTDTPAGTPTAGPTPEPTITNPETDEPGGFEIPIDETYFADPEFRNFISFNLDTNQNGYLSEAEINAVTELTIHAHVSNLEGIAFFGELVSLTCTNTPMTYLDVSRNAHLKYLNCDDNRLTELYLGDNSPLEQLSCSRNMLSSLDLSGCPKLQVLCCSGNSLSRLNIRNNTKLKELRCSENNLPLLNLTGLTELTALDCGCNRLTELDLSNCSLTELRCASNELTALDLQNHNSLKILDCSFNRDLGKLNTTNLHLLEHLNCVECGLHGTLDLEATPLLTYLDCSGNQLTYLPGLTQLHLTELNCSYNILTSLDLSMMNELKKIVCEGNELTSLLLAPNTEELFCRTNKLEELTLVPTLIYLDCSENQFMRFSPQGAPLLKTLDCSNNTFTSLDVRGLGALEELRCGDSNLTSLDLSGHSRLRTLDCSYSHVGSLDLSGCTSLVSVNCSVNRLSKLDLSGLINLVILNCSTNQLTKLDLTDTHELFYLLCEKNQLTSLDTRNCYRLAASAILSDKNLPVRLFTIRFDREKYAENNRTKLLSRADRYRKDLSGRYESGVIRTAGLIETIRSDDHTRVEIYESAVYGRIQGEDGETELYDYSVFARVVSYDKHLVTERIFTTTEPLTSDQRRFKNFPGRITNELCWGYDATPELGYIDLDYKDPLVNSLFDTYAQLSNRTLPTIQVIDTPGEWYYIDPNEGYSFFTELPSWLLHDANTGCIGISALISKDESKASDLAINIETYLFGNFSSTPDLMTYGETIYTSSTAETLEKESMPYALGVPGAPYSLSLGSDGWIIDGVDAGSLYVASQDNYVTKTRTFASGMVLTINFLPITDVVDYSAYYVEAQIEVSGTVYRPFETYYFLSERKFPIPAETEVGEPIGTITLY